MTLARRCGVHGAQREAAVHAVLQSLRDEPVDQVRIAWADLHGSFRCKTLIGLDTLTAAFDDGIGMVSTLLLKDTADRTAFKVFEPGGPPALPGFAAAGNVLMLPDPGSLQRLPWAPGTAWLRAEPWFSDGRPVEADPRQVLQRALATLLDAGFTLRCGLEVEFHIYRITDDGLGRRGRRLAG
jgi:glutamine synthetase